MKEGGTKMNCSAVILILRTILHRLKALTICSSVVLDNATLNCIKCHAVSHGIEVLSCTNDPPLQSLIIELIQYVLIIDNRSNLQYESNHFRCNPVEFTYVASMWIHICVRRHLRAFHYPFSSFVSTCKLNQ